jgi:hypothetical protein
VQEARTISIIDRQLHKQYDAFIHAMKFNDAAPLKRQFCVVVFCQHSVDSQLFVLIVFAHGRSALMKRRGE